MDQFRLWEEPAEQGFISFRYLTEKADRGWWLTSNLRRHGEPYQSEGLELYSHLTAEELVDVISVLAFRAAGF